MRDGDKSSVSPLARAVLGFAFGAVIMTVAVQIFFVSSYDFDNMVHGTRAMLSGINPWSATTRVVNFYNPPFAVLFLWPLFFTTPRIMLVIGGALLIALMFYTRTWVGAAWFATHMFTWMLAAGGIDMLVIGAGVLLLMVSDRVGWRWVTIGLRVLAYGVLLIKPQGGLFIVVIYVLLRRDWQGVLIAAIIYGVAFAPLYPAWLNILRTDPPLSQTEAAHSLWARFGPVVAIPVALLVLPSRRWTYWQLGGALAGILSPYGMPGVPVFLILTAVKRLAAIPVVVIYSGCLAVLTWVAPNSPLLGIYYLGMLGLGLILACLLPVPPGENAADEVGLRGAWYHGLVQR